MARPKKDPNDKYETPKRSWRVDDKSWELIKSAAEAEGKTLVGWALPILIKAAKRTLKGRPSA